MTWSINYTAYQVLKFLQLFKSGRPKILVWKLNCSLTKEKTGPKQQQSKQLSSSRSNHFIARLDLKPATRVELFRHDIAQFHVSDGKIFHCAFEFIGRVFVPPPKPRSDIIIVQKH